MWAPVIESEHLFREVILDLSGLKVSLTGLEIPLQNFYELSGIPFKKTVYILQCLAPYRGAMGWRGIQAGTSLNLGSST